MRTQSLVLLLTLLACGPVSANGAGDDLDRFLNSRGLGEQTAQPQAPMASPSPAPTSPPPSASRAQESAPESTEQRLSALVVAAMGALGVPYRRGGNGYDSGFDCSGFVRALYEQNFGLLLPRRAAEQATATHNIGREELKPGDLVFFNTLGRTFSHVGIYVGDHRFIHSPKSGAVVRIEDMRVNYWNRRFTGARRVVGQTTASVRPQASYSLSYPNY